MKTLNFNKCFCLCPFLLLIFVIVKGNQLDEKLETKAVKYFIELTEISNKEASFRIPKFTAGTPSKIYDIADALNKINLLKDSIPERERLDRIEKYNNEDSLLNRKIQIKLPAQKRSKKGSRMGMRVYNAIEYEGKYYVEIVLFSSKFNSEEIFCIEFDNFVPKTYYTKKLVFD
jgi:hypothetical protein